MKLRAYLSSTLLIASLLTGCALPPDSAGRTSLAPSSAPGADGTDVLIYAGNGSWQPEIDSLSNILYDHRATYRQVGSDDLNAMSAEELSRFRLVVFPGGDAMTVTHVLAPTTRERLREAIQQKGLSYLGFCAGAWLAVAPSPEPGAELGYGFSLVERPIQEPSYLGKEGRPFAISRATFPDGSQRDLLWYGGPTTPDLPGAVLARYPDGKPAISQIPAGRGLVIVSGLHPAANASILTSLGLLDREAIAPDYAWKLLDAGIRQRALPAF